MTDDDHDHGYTKMTCGLCGWHGSTDTGVCERCVFCRDCGQPYTDEVPCECNDEEED